MKAVVLLSGGMDSTTVLAKAINDGFHRITAVNCFYGSTHADRERLAAALVCEHYAWKFMDKVAVDYEEITLPDIFRGGRSALMGEVEMPHMTYEQIAESEGPSPTVVPFRNANLLSIATTIAITKDAEYVYAGMHAEDARNWAYPDCTPEFLGAMSNAVYVGSYNKVRLVFPFIWMMKRDIVTLAAALQAPLQRTYSCYMGGKNHCGKCPTCVERLQAFFDAGYFDPADYDYIDPAMGAGKSYKVWPTS